MVLGDFSTAPKATTTDHPEDGPGRLLHLVGATPPGFHRGQAKVTDFHRQPFVQEDV